METLAVNWGVPLMGTIPLAGRTAETTIAGTVTDAEVEFAGLVIEVAVTTTFRSAAGKGGAV